MNPEKSFQEKSYQRHSQHLMQFCADGAKASHALSWIEKEKVTSNGVLQKKVKRRIAVADFLCRIGLNDYALLSTIIFKRTPSKDILQNLIRHGYEVVYLPKNPYLN